jgi:hypothetical protein
MRSSPLPLAASASRSKEPDRLADHLLRQLSFVAMRTPSRLIATLIAGNYTAVVRGASGGTRIGLVEIYNLP